MTVVVGYAIRARHYGAEIAGTPQPNRLAGLLRPGLRIAEVPSATGHFLPAYARSEADVVLIDTCPEMLTEARRRWQREADRGVRTFRTVCSQIQDLTSAMGPVHLAVMPNASLNQLAVGNELTDLFTAVVRILTSRGQILGQVLVMGGGGSIRACRFYDPAIAERVWVTDREFGDEAGRQLARRRRQRRDGELLHIEFEVSQDNVPLYHHRVALRLLSAGELRTALKAAGFTDVIIRSGAAGLSEVTAVGPARSLQ
jgi:SAM-dependent methyltransferase